MHQSTVTFQAWNHSAQPRIDHLRIFGSTTYVLNESKPNPRLTTKAWTGYLVGYKGRNQYRIYNPICHAVFVRRDIIFDKASIGPKSDNLTANLTTTPESKVAFEFSSFCFPYFFGTDNADTTAPFSIPASIEHDKPITPPEPTPSSPDIKDENTLSNVSDAPDESDNDIFTAKTPPIINTNTATPVQRQSARLKAQPPINYQQINRGRAANVKSHPLIPHNSPHSKPTQAFF